MGKAANNAVNAANANDTSWQNQALDGYNTGVGSYMSNVNAQLAAGNPYQTKQYLQNQNLLTSAAANAANTQAQGALKESALRTGENTASNAATIASNSRGIARDLTAYQANRDTQNDAMWQQQKQQLLGDQLAGANSEANVFGTATGAQSSALGDLTSLQNSQDAMWGNIAGSAIGAAGTGGAAAITKW